MGISSHITPKQVIREVVMKEGEPRIRIVRPSKPFLSLDEMDFEEITLEIEGHIFAFLRVISKLVSFPQCLGINHLHLNAGGKPFVKVYSAPDSRCS